MYIGHFAWRQWLPWDDGVMAQAADRVLQGQLPHRDFNEAYTGGLTFLHVASFRLFGVSIWSLRTTLFVFAIASIPVWYYIARRFASPVLAGVATVSCVAWSVPNYPAPLPSWYNLFFAMSAVAAMMRYIEKGGLRWLLVAGVFVGFSILAKITGLYLGAAVALFLAFNSGVDAFGEPNRWGSRAIAIGLLAIASAFAIGPLLLALSAHDENSLNSLISLGLPPALIGSAVIIMIARQLAEGRRPGGRVVQELLIMSSGAAVVLVVFCIPYLTSHATAALATGVFARAGFRLQVPTAKGPGPDLASVAMSLPLVYACTRGGRGVSWSGVWGLVGFWIIADVAATSDLPGVLLWLSIRMLMLPLSVVVAWYICQAPRHEESRSIRSKQFVLVATVAAWCSLVQFPFTYPAYFAYVAPLVLLAAVALADVNGRPAPASRIVTLAGYCALAATMRPRIYPNRPVGPGPMTLLMPPKGGILVSADDANRYREVVALLKAHATGPYTLATPDLPEVYFLSGLRNPTGTFFEGFDFPPTPSTEILKTIDRNRITAIVINHRPPFSQRLAPGLEDSLGRRFPETQSLGQLEVRWHR